MYVKHREQFLAASIYYESDGCFIDSVSDLSCDFSILPQANGRLREERSHALKDAK